jgi:gamma-Secretase-activating protein C-term
LDENRRQALFTLMERFLYCAEALAYPVPQGFTSFFAYLGYRTLPWPQFIQYTRRHVFELHVDAIKAIFGDMTEKRMGVSYKVGLLQLLPRTRARRILNQWGHPISYMYRAREHALLLLSGESANRDHRPMTQRRYNNIGTRGKFLSLILFIFRTRLILTCY